MYYDESLVFTRSHSDASELAHLVDVVLSRYRCRTNFSVDIKYVYGDSVYTAFITVYLTYEKKR